MEIGEMLYKNISDIIGSRDISLGFEFKNERLIVKVESLIDNKKRDDIYSGIKSI